MIGLSVVTVAELVRGAYRAETQERQDRRLEFIERLSSDLPVYPVTIDIDGPTGRVEGREEDAPASKAAFVAAATIFVAGQIWMAGWVTSRPQIGNFRAV